MAAIWTSYSSRKINVETHDVERLGHKSIKCCQCLAIVTQLSHKICKAVVQICTTVAWKFGEFVRLLYGCMNSLSTQLQFRTTVLQTLYGFRAISKNCVETLWSACNWLAIAIVPIHKKKKSYDWCNHCLRKLLTVILSRLSHISSGREVFR